MTPIGEAAGQALKALSAEGRRSQQAESAGRAATAQVNARSRDAEAPVRVELSPEALKVRDDSAAREAQIRRSAPDAYGSGSFPDEDPFAGSRPSTPKSVAQLEDAFARNAAAFQQAEARRETTAAATDRNQDAEGLALESVVE